MALSANVGPPAYSGECDTENLGSTLAVDLPLYPAGTAETFPPYARCVWGRMHRDRAVIPSWASNHQRCCCCFPPQQPFFLVRPREITARKQRHGEQMADEKITTAQHDHMYPAIDLGTGKSAEREGAHAKEVHNVRRRYRTPLCSPRVGDGVMTVSKGRVIRCRPGERNLEMEQGVPPSLL
jgi:hypothetical protein